MNYSGSSSLFYNHNIDDEEIKTIISEHKQGKCEFNKVTEYLAPLIYSFPKLFSSMDEDSCGSFFEYMLTRIEKMISSYTITKVKFISWFIIVLRRSFYNWVKYETSNDKYLLSLNKPVNKDIQTELINFIVYEQEPVDEQKIEIRKIMDTLPDNIKIIVRLHYFDFFSDSDIIQASKIFKLDINNLLYKYNKIKNAVLYRKNDIFSLQEKLAIAYEKYEKLKSSNQKLNNNQDFVKAKKKYLKRLNELKSSFTTLTNKEISELLNIDIRKIANLLFRGRKMLEEKLNKYQKVDNPQEKK